MELDSRTHRWTLSQLPPGTEITGAERLGGGWSSLVRAVHTRDRDYVLRTMIRPELADRAEEMVTREARVLGMLAGTGLPVPRVLGADPSGTHTGMPSLLTTRLPGRIEIGDDHATGARAVALARQLAAIHRVRPPVAPPPYVAWSWPGEIVTPPDSPRPGLWRRAEELITREPPRHPGRFLHRDFHPGNVLFEDTAITGVVDWTETSWGPADLDVAHCATMLALLHGDDLAETFVGAYRTAGGALAPDRHSHLYWRLLDALSFAPAAANAGGPWRELGRTDLTAEVLGPALERHLAHLLDTYG
ncbi:phosphotransferase family protein [Actinoplanes sp. G11-F43]|uniref:phosphotransferase family protein n=1 Tax=Actinoplanes sp. G11-F43 TaxID=3424130 RepID=UPI003D345B6A